MTINLIDPDLIDTVAVLRRVADDLDAERRATDRQVDVLLDGGWAGGAARAYLDGWEVWRAGCDEVLAALHAMAELIATARADLVRQDDAAHGALQALTADLLRRLS